MLVETAGMAAPSAQHADASGIMWIHQVGSGKRDDGQLAATW